MIEGSGIFNKLKQLAKSAVNSDFGKNIKSQVVSHAKNVGNQLIRKGKEIATSKIKEAKSKLKDKLDEGENFALNKIHSIPEFEGSGLLDSLLMNVIPSVVNALTGHGLINHKKLEQHGHGLIGDILKSVAPTAIDFITNGHGIKKHCSGFFTNVMKSVAPTVIDAAANLAKNKISGSGRKCKSGSSLIPAGAALYPASVGPPLTF
mmetsp:Transcript_54489/g.143981  ORF Transcript_54489/g.143981 Transcript_54489/m.143981 type:complete len:206 (+) Transcript_54489:446-1063(+)